MPRTVVLLLQLGQVVLGFSLLYATLYMHDNVLRTVYTSVGTVLVLASTVVAGDVIRDMGLERRRQKR